MKIQKPVGLFKRLVSRAIDFIFVAVISIGLIFIMATPHKIGPATFYSPWMFYVWSLITILSIGIFMILIPLATKGWTIGMKIMKIKIIVHHKHIYKAIMKKEIAFSISWIIIALLCMIVLNHTLIDSAAMIKGYKNPINKLSNFEKSRITFVGSISGLIWFVQMWLCITIIPNEDKRGWNDRWAQVSIVSTNQKIIKHIEKEVKIIKPVNVFNNKVEWINTKE